MPKQPRRTAHEFLRWVLREGPVVESIVLEMAESEGISSARIDRAVERLGIYTKKRRAKVVMVLPGHEQDTDSML